MEKKIRVLMIDDNESFVSTTKKYFSSHAVINIVLEAHNGKDGLRLALEKEKEYDLILLDLIMPNKDGLFFLHEFRKLEKLKDIIVMSGMGHDDTLKKVSSYGVKYFMLKPFDFNDLENRILDHTESSNKVINLSKNSLHLEITKLLHNLGIPSHIKGYQYIRESVYLMFIKPDLIGGITKELYPEIASKFETTASRVERAIRHAIEVSWNRGDYNLMEDLFGNSVDYDRAKPTNSEFIATLADKLRLNKIIVNN